MGVRRGLLADQAGLGADERQMGLAALILSTFGQELADDFLLVGLRLRNAVYRRQNQPHDEDLAFWNGTRGARLGLNEFSAPPVH